VPVEPVFSVILAIHDGGAGCRTAESVLAQTSQHWELVVVECSDAARRLKARVAHDPRIRFYAAPNASLAAARNAGVREARGTIAVHVDEGDQLAPDYLKQLSEHAHLRDVWISPFEVAHPSGERRLWAPAEQRQRLFARRITRALGLAHRRELFERLGGFNEEIWDDEIGELLRRWARAGVEFVFTPVTSGTCFPKSAEIPAQRLVRAQPPTLTLPRMGGGSKTLAAETSLRVYLEQSTLAQRKAVVQNHEAGRPLFTGSAPPRPVRSVAFASSHSILDPTGGAAVATASLLRLLARSGFQCQAFCASQLDAEGEPCLEEFLAEGGVRYTTRRARVGSAEARLTFAVDGDVPVTVFRTAHTTTPHMSRDEQWVFLDAFEMFLGRNRPDVLLTYGGRPVDLALVELAKRRDIIVVFLLHNLHYEGPRPFLLADHVIVPSQFAREHYWNNLGLSCQCLPNILDRKRVVAESREPRCATFVNPQRSKGSALFARIAQELAKRRPEIPLLVVAGRAQERWAEEVGLDLREVKVEQLAATSDPRRFYSKTKLLLMPAVEPETFGLTAAEAMLNGIPVLASRVGALPEVLGEAARFFDIDEQVGTSSATDLAPAQYEPWIEAIERLWDDTELYRQASEKAREHAQQWTADRLGPRIASWFANVTHQPAPPLLPPAQPAPRPGESPNILFFD
jgi:glycosyltransferase involved in cell wall biosynthesis